MVNTDEGIPPILVVLLLVGLFTAYLFLSFSHAQYAYAGDYPFVFTKLGVLLSIIALGYFTTLFSPFVSLFPFGAKHITKIMRLFSLQWVRQLFMYISGIWFIAALALLPFGHSVVDTNTGALDRERTRQLMIFYRVVYASPYYFVMVAFSLSLFFMIIALGNWNNTISPPTKDFRDVFRDSYKATRATLGFYFRGLDFEDDDDADATAD